MRAWTTLSWLSRYNARTLPAKYTCTGWLPSCLEYRTGYRRPGRVKAATAARKDILCTWFEIWSEKKQKRQKKRWLCGFLSLTFKPREVETGRPIALIPARVRVKPLAVGVRRAPLPVLFCRYCIFLRQFFFLPQDIIFK